MDEPGCNMFNRCGAAPINHEAVAHLRECCAGQHDTIANGAPRVPCSPPWSTYVLRGFGCAFLEMRPIMFESPLPSVRVCVSCKVVSAKSLLLPCGHTVCDACPVGLRAGHDGPEDDDVEADQGPHAGRCPLDGLEFFEHDVLYLDYSLERVHRELVHCLNAPSGCPFVAELRFLREHYVDNCHFRERTCTRCGRGVPASAFLGHSLQCQWR